jgi:hypothetical protein
MHVGIGEPWSEDQYTAFRAGYEAWCRENGKRIYPDETPENTTLTEYLNRLAQTEAPPSVGKHARR